MLDIFKENCKTDSTSKNTFFVSLHFFTSYSWCLNPTLISNNEFSAFRDILYIPCPCPVVIEKVGSAIIFSRVHATLYPALSVRRSVGRSVGPLFTFSAFLRVLNSLLLPKCPSDLLHHCPCPPARD